MFWRGALPVVLAFAAAQAPARADVQCPPALDSHPFARASVFDGPPEEEADLVPDSNTGDTDVWQLVYDGGRNPYLVCRYDGTDKTVTMRLQRPVMTCTSHRRPPRGAACH